MQFLSNNHFHFLVFSKDVGFLVYKLRRVIGSTFDVYFHLWNNGTPHWEREKRAWEIEQEKEWTKVLSKCSKKAAAKASKPQKRVSFAKQLIYHSPPKSSPPQWIIFGAFSIPVKPIYPERLVFNPMSIMIVFFITQICNGVACNGKKEKFLLQTVPAISTAKSLEASFQISDLILLGLIAPVAKTWAIPARNARV